MNRIDPQAAAGAVEHFGEQAASLGLAYRGEIRADRLQILRQRDGIRPNPPRQHLIDPGRHFSRTGLGEGQAQNLIRANIVLQEQAQHARREDLGLARPGRSRKPDDLARIDRRVLLIGQGKQPAHAPPSPRACHSSSRISWS